MGFLNLKFKMFDLFINWISVHSMHPSDIKFLIKLKGKTIKQLAYNNNVSALTINKALLGNSKLGEIIISEFLDIPLNEIWPLRWSAENTRTDY